MKDEQFATLDDTILYIWKNAKHLNLNNINRMIQELKVVLEKDENKKEINNKKEANELDKEYEKIPVNCQICEFFLEDDYFIEEFKTIFVCSVNDETNPKFLGFDCDDFKVEKWHLVEFLKRLSGEKK